MTRTRRRGALVVGALAAIGATPSLAGAVTPLIDGDDGNPIPITPGLALRNMDADVGFALAPGETYLNATLVGPDGAQAATPLVCSSSTSGRNLDYRGNGVYTVVVQAFGRNDFRCATPLAAPVTAQVTIQAGILLSAPPRRVLIRQPNSLGTRTINIGVNQNPGATTTELRYARGGVLGGDGAISGPSETGFVDRSTGLASLRLDRPGNWVVVARAQGFSSSGEFFSPWSPAVVVRAVAPFDLERVNYPDSRGPSYQLAGKIREESARGSVRVLIARGARGGRYRSLGRSRIRGNGAFVKRFTQRSPGVYRLRYRFAGSPTVAGGTVTQRVRITRRVFVG